MTTLCASRQACGPLLILLVALSIHVETTLRVPAVRIVIDAGLQHPLTKLARGCVARIWNSRPQLLAAPIGLPLVLWASELALREILLLLIALLSRFLAALTLAAIIIRCAANLCDPIRGTLVPRPQGIT